MVTRDELTKFIESTIGLELLSKAKTIDPFANGVQFVGSEQVEKVILGVSLNVDFLNEAVAASANYCVFHHGLDPRTDGAVYSMSAQKRLKLIFDNNLTIAGYHHALDAQNKFGNNASIAQLLGAKIIDMLDEGWGCVAKLKNPMTQDELSEKCAEIFSHDVLAIKAGDKTVQILGINSGGASPYDKLIGELHSKNIDVYITGESNESRPHVMQEEGINFFLCGHYATEVFAVQELGKLIKTKFGKKIEVEFIDIPNPL